MVVLTYNLIWAFVSRLFHLHVKGVQQQMLLLKRDLLWNFLRLVDLSSVVEPQICIMALFGDKKDIKLRKAHFM